MFWPLDLSRHLSWTAMRDLAAWWGSPAWRAEALRWIHETLDQLGIKVTGEATQPRTRFWSTQLVIPTEVGTLWFKENSPSQAFEAALVVEVERLVPGHVVPALAVEPGRGWMLSRDAGVCLWDTGAVTAEHWVRILQEYAGLQRALEGHRPELLATGLPAMPEGEAAAYLVEQVEVHAALPATHPLAMPAHLAATTLAEANQVARAADSLVASGIPASLQHNDLHPGNVFVPDAGPLELIDLGDAVWAHPFCVARIPLWTMRGRLELAPDDPLLSRARDAYLEPWTDLAPLAELRALLPAAERISCLHRAESWRRLQAEVPPGRVDAGWRDTAYTWLATAAAPDPYAAAR